MDIQTTDIIYFLKLISLGFSGLFAGIGVITDFKKGGRITKWGRIGVIGVVSTTLISIILHSLEDNERRSNFKTQQDSLTNSIGRQISLIEKSDSSINKLDSAINILNGLRSLTDSSIDQQKTLLDKSNNSQLLLKKSILNQIDLSSISREILDESTESLKSQNDLSTKTESILDSLRSLFEIQKNLESEIEGSQLPLNELEIDIVFENILDQSEHRTYLLKIISFAEKLKTKGNYQRYSKIEELNDDAFQATFRNDSLVNVTIDFGHPLWPKDNNESGSMWDLLYLHTTFLVQFENNHDEVFFRNKNGTYYSGHFGSERSERLIINFDSNLIGHQARRIKMMFEMSGKAIIKNRKDLNGSLLKIVSPPYSKPARFTIYMGKGLEFSDRDLQFVEFERQCEFGQACTTFMIPSNFF